MFKLLTYASDTGPRPGLLIHERVLDLGAAVETYTASDGGAGSVSSSSVLAVLERWDAARPILQRIAESYTRNPQGPATSFALPLSSVKLLAPLLYPGAIYCAAANYTDHMREMSGREPPDKRTTRPYFFLKTPRQSVIGPDETIRLPKMSSQIDWEAEIGVIIGQTAHQVSVEDALTYVAGYTIVNDLSARDLIRRDDWNFGNDWYRGKCFDTSAPMGPWITPAEAIPDPHDLSIRLWVNDQLMQDSSSRMMHFTIPEQIAYLSEQLTLWPGDVISTGTPAGVGRPKGIFLKSGDAVTITIAGLGTLRNQVT